MILLPLDARRRRDGRREEKVTPADYSCSGTISEFFMASQQPNECVSLVQNPVLQGERPWIVE